MTDSIWTQEVIDEGLDRDHHDAILCDEFLNITRTFDPILDDEATAGRVQEIESTRGIHWGDTTRGPLTYREVKTAFNAIEAGAVFCPETLDYDLVGGY